MSGQPGRSGRRRKPLADHVLNGTYRRDRHGPLPATLPAWPETPAPLPPWRPDAADVADLGAAGRHFLTALLEQFDVDLVQGLLLLEAAATVDSLVIWRAQAATDPKAARLAIQYTRTLAALLQQAELR